MFLCKCSGTHLSNTKEAEAFALVSEEGIAKGVRRVTALTMGAAKEAIHQSEVFSGQIDEASKLEGAALEKVGCFFFIYYTHFIESNHFHESIASTHYHE